MLNVLSLFGQGSTYTLSDPSLNTVSPNDASAISAAIIVIYAALFILAIPAIIGLWKVFSKAGRPGWASIIPFYNYYVLLQIVGRPTWWMAFMLLAFIPFVGSIAVFVVSVIIMNDLSKSFGKSTGFTVLMVLLPFIAYPMLGFGSAQYHGPSVAPQGPAGPGNGFGGGTPTQPTPPAPTAPQGPIDPSL